MLSQRECSILGILHETDGFITAEAISGRLAVSPKTVRNDLTEIKCFLQQANTGSLSAKPSYGMRLNITPPEWEKLQSLMKEDTKAGDGMEDRILRICGVLLRRRRTSMGYLEQSLYISRSRLEKALPLAEQWLADCNILLQRRRGQGICILCDEFDWRLAMWRVFLAVQPKEQQDRNLFSEMGVGRLRRFLDGFDAAGVIEAMRRMEEQFGISLSYDSQRQMLFLLSILVFRHNTKGDTAPRKAHEENEFNRVLAEALAGELGKLYKTRFTEAELDYIEFIAGISEIQRFTNVETHLQCENAFHKLCKFTVKLITLVEDILKVNLKSDESLASSLFLYLRSAIARKHCTLPSENPLLEKIKTRYPNIYAAAWSTSILFENELGVEVNEDEIGFIALYIGGAVERVNVVCRACMMCNYGVGISQLLKERIERGLGNLEIVDVVTTRDIERIQASGCDFIITTHQVPPVFAGKDVIVVDNFLLPYDVKAIQSQMQKVRRRKMNRISRQQGIWERDLFDSRLVRIFPRTRGKEQLLREMCGQLVEKGYVAEAFTQSVLDREKITSTEIGSGVAIPHGFTRFVMRPVVSVALLEKPMPWYGGSSIEMIFLLAFNMEDVLHMKAQIVKFYSALVSLIDDSERLRGLKKLHDAEKLAEFLNQLIREENSK